MALIVTNLDVFDSCRQNLIGSSSAARPLTVRTTSWSFQFYRASWVSANFQRKTVLMRLAWWHVLFVARLAPLLNYVTLHYYC